jgi:hypothetical protein
MNYMPPPNMQPQTNTMAIISLVCAILGLVGFLPIIGSIVGIILGKKAQTEIANSGGLQSGDQLAKGGVIVGWVGLGLAALAILCICAIFGLGIGGAIFEGSRR